MRNRKISARGLLLIVFTFLYCLSHAQGPTDSLPDDPGAFTVSVSKLQDMNFGAFSITGSGGSIVLSNSGMRTTTGGAILLNLGYLYYQAIFEVEALEGTIINIMNGPEATLTGSNGGTATLQLGTSNPGSPFVITTAPPARTAVNIGGTLSVGTSPPPGTYTGTFSVTFNYQ